MFVKPKDGVRVMIPSGLRMRQMPDSGMEVSDTDLYWNRRITQGDVEVVEPAAKAAQPEAKAADHAAEPAQPAAVKE